MPAVTFLNPAEHKHDTSCAAVNNYLGQLIRETGEDWRVQEHTRMGVRRYGLFRGKPYKMYTLYFGIGGVEYQIINFWLDSLGSINHTVEAEVLVNWIMGMLAGIDTAKRSLGKHGLLGKTDPNHPLVKIIDYVRSSPIQA